MSRRVLRDDQWERIAPLLPGKATDCGVTAKDNRRFLEGVLWIVRTGSPWRDLPSEYGHWHRVYVRYNRWSHKGIWQNLILPALDGHVVKRVHSLTEVTNGKGSKLGYITQTTFTGVQD